MNLWLALSVGGALGVLLRYALVLQFQTKPHLFFAATLLANAIGCFIIGASSSPSAPPIFSQTLTRAFLLIGFCGGLTTFSSFVLECMIFGSSGRMAEFFVYLCGSLVAGFAAFAMGRTFMSMVYA